MKRKLATMILFTAVSCGSALAQVGKSQGLLDVNTASETELLALPHMNAEIVKKIVDVRPFPGIIELNTLLIQQKLTHDQAAEFYEKAFVHINLNTATRDEIILIPRAGKKMTREFAEYRPWKNWKQFEKEIGKYVGETEAARLAQYCFIPINLNTAGKDELSTIPAISPDLVERIVQHRPWKSVADFQKAITEPAPDKPAISEAEAKRIARYLIVDDAKKHK
jgi:DNA uptake protein ComE-like DNA-binding protein